MLNQQDAFHMVLEGPELTTPHAQFSRFHRYLFGLNVTTSGSYNVTLLHYATNYDAVREMEENSPRSGTRLLMQSYPVELTAVPESSVATGLCSRTAANSGSFQRIASHPLPRTLKKSAHRMRPYAWTPHCAYDQRFYNHENDTCFRQNRSVLFLGDSQARETYVLLRKRLAGDTMAVPVATRNPRAKYVFGNEEEAHLEIAWMEDDFLDRLRDIEFLDAYDSVVVDVGHACLGIKTEKGGLWKMAFFQQHIRNIFGSLSGYNKQRSRRGLKAMQILFLGIQSIGICEDADPERCPKLGMYAGWRTPDRMRIANQVAREAHASNPTFMEEIQFLDGFDWTSPWILDAFDGLSFVGTPGLSALVDEVLHRLNLCSMGS
ncbi:hypothetical protein BC830DRAFT_870977 [Chytriomyces sp. MP71]|nr:hypothetical protein BC830DRAFT_870977 [Chytriomyces sp. MP71]